MGFWDRLRGASDTTSELLKPIVQRVPLPVAATPRPSSAKPAAPKPAPTLLEVPVAAKPVPAAVAPSGKDGLAHFRRGLMRQAGGDHAGAVEEFTRALDLDPACGEAYASRGISREFLGDVAAAKADYAKSIELEVRAEIRRLSSHDA